MKKIILCLICIVTAIGISAGIRHSKIEIKDDYALKSEVQETLNGVSQEAFIEQVVCNLKLVEALNNEEKDYEEIAAMFRNNYEKVVARWNGQEKQPETLEEESANFYFILMDCYLGSQNYSNYADGKDALNASGEKIAAAFVREKEIKSALYISEARFKAIYDLGKLAQLESMNQE